MLPHRTAISLHLAEKTSKEEAKRWHRESQRRASGRATLTHTCIALGKRKEIVFLSFGSVPPMGHHFRPTPPMGKPVGLFLCPSFSVLPL
jgi:hypothetical protein